MNIVIIEDEINAFEYLRDLIVKIEPGTHLMAHLDSVEDSINWFHKKSSEVDLIFLDIQLSDGLSFEIFRHVKVDTPIIFTTAYDEYAINAFKLNSIDYLLKPIDKEQLFQAVTKLKSLEKRTNQSSQIEYLLKGLKKEKRNRFLVKKGSHFEFINAEDLSFIHSEDSLTFLYMKDGRRHLYSKTVATLDEELDDQSFFQINRKQIVNINAVNKIHPFLNQRLKLDMGKNDGGIDFIVSRNRTMDFKQWIDK